MVNTNKKDVWKLISIVVIILYAVFLIYPLFQLLKESVVIDGVFTLKNFVEFFSKNYYLETIFNSF
jgi:iron(III) transport system permease protein